MILLGWVLNPGAVGGQSAARICGRSQPALSADSTRTSAHTTLPPPLDRLSHRRAPRRPAACPVLVVETAGLHLGAIPAVVEDLDGGRALGDRRSCPPPRSAGPARGRRRCRTSRTTVARRRGSRTACSRSGSRIAGCVTGPSCRQDTRSVVRTMPDCSNTTATSPVRPARNSSCVGWSTGSCARRS